MTSIMVFHFVMIAMLKLGTITESTLGEINTKKKNSRHVENRYTKNILGT